MDTPNGAALLRQHISARGELVSSWAKKHGFARITIARFIKGERKRITVTQALAIERATNGDVPASSWAEVAS